jgi:hypothetical protein
MIPLSFFRNVVAHGQMLGFCRVPAWAWEKDAKIVEICKNFSRKCRVFFIIWRFPFSDGSDWIGASLVLSRNVEWARQTGSGPVVYIKHWRNRNQLLGVPVKATNRVSAYVFRFHIQTIAMKIIYVHQNPIFSTGRWKLFSFHQNLFVSTKFW